MATISWKTAEQGGLTRPHSHGWHLALAVGWCLCSFLPTPAPEASPATPAFLHSNSRAAFQEDKGRNHKPHEA